MPFSKQLANSLHKSNIEKKAEKSAADLCSILHDVMVTAFLEFGWLVEVWGEYSFFFSFLSHYNYIIKWAWSCRVYFTPPGIIILSLRMWS